MSIKLPCRIYSDRVVVDFLDTDSYASEINDVISIIEDNLGKPLNMNSLRSYIRKKLGSDVIFHYVMKALSNYYEIRKIEPRNIDLLIRYYEEINENYGGFIPLSYLGGVENELIELREEIRRDLLAACFPIHIINKCCNPNITDLISLANYYILNKALSLSKKINIIFKCSDKLPKILKFLIYRAKRWKAFIDVQFRDNKLFCEIINPYYYLPQRLARSYGKRISLILSYSLHLFKPWELRAELVIKGKEYLWKIDSESLWAPKFTPPSKTNLDFPLFDSEVEREVFVALENELGKQNCEVMRESTIINLDESFFIPDITLSCQGKKLFIEIIGFWTERYITKKREKIKRLINKGIRNIIFLIDAKLEKHFKRMSIQAIYYDSRSIDKACREVIDKILSSLKKD